MKLTFLGAVGTVTGSKYLLNHQHSKFLIDCGLFQGLKELRLRNWQPLPINASEIEAVFLTHAHIDHSGYIPLLIKHGFKGKIFCSEGTRELCEILLPDSGHLQEEDAFYANQHGFSKHHPALPLYTKDDAIHSLKFFKTVEFGKFYSFKNELEVCWHHAGHILGASCVEIRNRDTNIVFSGDLGRPHDLIMNPPAKIQQADYLVLESTYGDRLHDTRDPLIQIESIVNQTLKRGGTIVVPTFAVGRAQSLLYCFEMLKQQNRIPPVPIYLDSPMAINATETFCRFPHEHRLGRKECESFGKTAIYVNTVEESKKILYQVMPKIIISASGMATGGRVLHHLKNYASDSKNTILFTGYQAEGTRGDRIIRGEKEVKIHGEMVPIRAHIEILENMSAHADYQEVLQWLQNFTQAPRKVFITHGEALAAKALKERISAELGWKCEIPQYLETVEL